MGVVYPQVRTSADLLKSTIRIDELQIFLQQQGAEACAIVDTRLYGLLPFWHAMNDIGVHAVVGLTVQVQFPDGTVYPLVLYAQTNEGYQHLLKITSAVAIQSNELLPWKWLVGYAKGCIVLVPILEGEWLTEQGKVHFTQLRELFTVSALYVGVSRFAGHVHFLEAEAIDFCKSQNCTIIATQQSNFIQPEDFTAYEVATAIEQGKRLEDINCSNEQHHYVLTAEQWTQFFHDMPQWLENARTMLLKCHVTMTQEGVHMPKFPLPADRLADDELAWRAMEGLKMRLNTITPDARYVERLFRELEVIRTMGYSDYFLIVADFIAYARQERILVGPGRGSSASSLVAYSMQITQVDPIQYGLLFERFLNPERISLPDIDVDFADSKRQKVIQYVATKYGKSHVAQIITFGTLSAKAVARDVARVFGLDAETMAFISKEIPNKPGITLQQVYEQSESIRQWMMQQPRHAQWFVVAKRLEGLPKNSSTHAAGVVLSPKPLVEVVPIELGHDDVYLTQWPMQEVEQMGLVKIDFLGLRNLTILESIRWSIYQTGVGWIDFDKIPLHDEKTFQLLQTGDTAGIFQLESDGMKEALQQIKPNHFLDIVAINALYRPGPMAFIPLYARRKHGQEQVVIPHPVLEPILRETYGVLIFQEQIMQITVTMAGFTVGQADVLRRAVSKKQRAVLEEQRVAFVNGARTQGYDEHIANDVYALIVRFADYGFPKSHAVAYSMISYQMAYLKANYPANFYAALLSNSIGNVEKLHDYVNETQSKGITLLMPSITRSQRHFTVEDSGRSIRFGLGAIKGVPAPFLTELLALRKKYPQAFQNFFDLAVCLGSKHFKPKILESLIYAGVFDEYGKDRAVLIASLNVAIKNTELIRPNEEIDYETAMAIQFGRPKYIEAQPMSTKEKLLQERHAIGFYLSEHPIINQRVKWPRVNGTTKTMKQLQDGAFVCFVGFVEEIRKIRTKKGEQMAFVHLEDEVGDVSVTLFPKEFTQVADWLAEDKIVYVEGVLERRSGKMQVIVKVMKRSED